MRASDNSCDLQGNPYLKLSEAKHGDTVIVDDGFSCIKPGPIKIFNWLDTGKLYFQCNDGCHFLEGQADDGEHCVGIYKVRS